MYKGLIVLGAVAVLLNPLTGVQIQSLVVDAWDWLIVYGGWVATVAFTVGLVFVAGVAYAQSQAKDKKKLSEVTKKAKNSKKSNRSGMKYELVKQERLER